MTSKIQLVILTVCLSILLMLSLPTHADILAYDFQIAAKKAETWKGIDVFASLYDPAIQANSNKYVAVPVAITTYSHPVTFLEVGPIKTCYSTQTCQLRPYYSWATPTASGFSEDTTRLLGSGLFYRYKVDKTQVANEFQGIFCNGNGCGVVWTQNLGRNDLPFLFTAVETTNGARIWPPVRISMPQGKNASNIWNPFCFDSTNTNYPGDGRVFPDPCNASLDGWELRTGFQSFIPVVIK